jgi:hypothetical protein
MKTHRLTMLGAALLLTGCSTATDPKAAPRPRDAKVEEAEVQANLIQLPPEERLLAEGQRWCAVESENRLGSMGKPFKVEVKGQAVYLCCKSCRKAALADPDRTLAKVKALKEKAAGSP